MKFTEPTPKQTKNSLWRWVPGIVISLIAIFALFRFVKIGDTFSILVKIPFIYILFTVLFTLLFLVVRAAGWKALLGKKASYRESFLKINEGYFVNNVFPLRLGEISRALFMGASMNVHPGQVLSAIVIERVFDLMILAVALLIMVPHALGMAWAKNLGWIVLIAMMAGFFFLFLIIKNQVVVRNFLLKLAQKTPFLKSFVLPLIFSLLDGFQVINSFKQLFLGFLGVLGSWLVSLFQYSVLLLFFVSTANWWWGAFANTVMAMGIALPSAPAGLGIFETSIVAALKLFNINEEISLAYAILLHVTQFIVTAVIGLFALYRDGYSIKGLFSKLSDQKRLGINQETIGS